MNDFDFVAHLVRQREFSERTFGPGLRTGGVVEHIRQELAEVEADPLDLTERIDVVILALDGALRLSAHLGMSAEEGAQRIVETIVAKQTKNEARDWPDWRLSSQDEPINHVRGAS